MNFGFTEEQELLREQVRRFFDDKSPVTETRKVMESKTAYSSDTWQEMAALGWLALIVPEAYDGLGLSWVDLIVVLEESGRTLVPSPLISQMLSITALVEAGSEAQKQKWLPKLADGSTIASLALFDEANFYAPESVQLKGEESDGVILNGTKNFVADLKAADLFIVAYRRSSDANDIGFALVEKDTEGLKREGNRAFDRTKSEGTLIFDQVKIPSENILSPNDTQGTFSYLLNCGALAVTAETIGVAEAGHKICVDYANERTQFGSKIGRYQGVKHPLADMYVDIESYKSLLYYASWCATNARDEFPRQISCAKAYASECMPVMATNFIQLHGAIGYTDEYDIQLYYKRAKWMRPAFGDANFHYDRIAELGGL